MEKSFAHWEDKIKTDFRNNNFNKKTLKTKERNLMMVYVFLTVLSFLGSIAIMIALVIVICNKQPFSATSLGCVIAFSIVFKVCTIIFFLMKATQNYQLWWEKMSQLLGFEQYYKLAINEATNGKIRLVDISKNFSVAPWKPLMKKKFSYRQNNKILNMIYEDKIAISFGTVLVSEGYYMDRLNYSYPYLACELLHKNLNLDVAIAKSNFFSRIADKTDLESTVFEKLYSVNATDQIEVRKLLTPKVIENLILIAKNYKIPEMTFKDKFLVFCFERQRLSLGNKCDNKLVCFNFKEAAESWAVELINLINHDLNLLLDALKWLFCFEQLTMQYS